MILSLGEAPPNETLRLTARFGVRQAGTAVMLYGAVPRADRPQLWSLLASSLATWVLSGFVTGIVFASVVARFAGDSASTSLSMRRFVIWGGPAGGFAPALAVPLLVGMSVLPGRAVVVLTLSGIGAILGAVTASATVRIARRAEHTALLASATEVA